MAGKSTYLENALLNHSMGKAAFGMPATIYAALCTVVPGAGDTGSTITEIVYTGYARKQVLAADLNAAAAGVMTNANAIVWGTMTGGAGGAVVAVAFLDAAAAGNLLRWGTANLTVTTGIPPTILAGNLSISES